MKPIRPVLAIVAAIATLSAVLFMALKYFAAPEPEPVSQLGPPESFEVSNWPPPPLATPSPPTSSRPPAGSVDRADRSSAKSSQGGRSTPSITPAVEPSPWPAEDTRLDSAGQLEPGEDTQLDSAGQLEPGEDTQLDSAGQLERSEEPRRTETPAEREERKRQDMAGQACDTWVWNQFGCRNATGTGR